MFVIRRGGEVRNYFGRYMGERSTAVFLRGPAYARDMVTDLDAVPGIVSATAGFFLDFDARAARIFDTGIVWNPEDFEDPSSPGPLGTALRAADVASLDLYPEEKVLIEVARAGTTQPALQQALEAVELKDNYRGWTITWVKNAAALLP
jgi:hypothetical protein